MAATPEALSSAPCVASGGTSRLAMTMIVPCVRPLETAQTFCSATSLPLTVAAKLSMCVSSPMARNCCSTQMPMRLSGSVPATRWGKSSTMVTRSAYAASPSNDGGSWLSLGVSALPSVNRATTTRTAATTQATRYTFRLGRGDLLGRAWHPIRWPVPGARSRARACAGRGRAGAGGYDDLMPGPARILVVDDEARIAEVVQSYLEGEGHTVVRAATGEDALAAVASRRPDLVVLDLGLPGMSGEDVCRRLRAESDVPIIMLTAKDAEEDLVHGPAARRRRLPHQAVQPARAHGARARAAAARAPGRSPQADVLERAGGRLVVDSARRRVTLDGELVELTESEFRLLQTLARFPGRVYTRSELVERVQGMEFEPYERTIDAHVKNLRRKLGDDARAPRLVLTVYGRGYAFAEDQR